MSTPAPHPSSTSFPTTISHSTLLPGSSPRSSPSSSTMSTSTSTITKTTTISVSMSSTSTPASTSTPTRMSISTPAHSSSPTKHNNKSSNDNNDHIKTTEPNPPPTQVPPAIPIAPTTKTTSTTTIPMIPHGNLTLKSIDTTNTPYPLSCLRTPPKWPIRRPSVPGANGSVWKAVIGMEQDGVVKVGREEEEESLHEEEEEGGGATLPVFEGNGPASGAVGDVRESVEVDVDVDVDDAGDVLPHYDGVYGWESGFWCSTEARRRDSIFNDEEKMGVWTGRVEWPESGMRSSIKREAMREVGETGGSDGEEEGRRKRVRVER